MLHDYTSPDDYQTIIETSRTTPVFIFKHSTICPMSSAAFREFTAFVASHPELPCWKVLVRENRHLSLSIAEKSGITHQSPQVIIYYLGKPIWDCSHGQITELTLDNSLNSLFS